MERTGEKGGRGKFGVNCGLRGGIARHKYQGQPNNSRQGEIARHKYEGPPQVPYREVEQLIRGRTQYTVSLNREIIPRKYQE